MNSDELALKDEHEKFIANINRKTVESKRLKIKNGGRGVCVCVCRGRRERSKRSFVSKPILTFNIIHEIC